MIGHKICFNRKVWKIIPKLSLFPILIWSAENIAMLFYSRGWSGGAMVLGKLPVPGRPTIWIQ